MTGDRTPLRERCGATTESGDGGPCILSPGHAESLHEASNGTCWLVDVPDATVTITADTSAFEIGVKDARITALEGQVTALRERAEEAEAAVERVRRLQELTIAASCRVEAINQARDTLAALEPPKETP